MPDYRDGYIIHEVLEERTRQDDKWGPREERNISLLEWWAVLSEEYGEAAHDVVDAHFSDDRKTRGEFLQHLRLELIQTTAVGVSMLGALDKMLENEGYTHNVHTNEGSPHV